MSRDPTRMQEILAQYQRQYKEFTGPVIDLVKKYLEGGMDVDKAIQRALSESGLISKNKDSLIGALLASVADGAGVALKDIPDPAKVQKTLFSAAWAPDKMNLSKRLHGASAEMRQTIVDTISTAMRLGKSWVGMARDLYDGYNAGRIINPVELPDYLDNLVRQARRVLAGDTAAMKSYQAAIRQAQAQISKVASGGAPTKALKAAYSQLLDATQSMSAEALDNAVRVAIEEKTRYIADRIARTEISAAWGDGFLAKHKTDPDVVAFRWRLNSRHPRYDICDLHASVNLYGLGPGVYPKNAYLRRPAHPHCMCPIEPVYVGEIDADPDKEGRKLKAAKFDSKAMDEFLDSLPRHQQLQLLGVDGLKMWERGGDWHKHLKNWESTDNPKSWFSTEDLGIDAVNEDAVSKMFTSGNVVIPDSKILGYSLNKEHPRGGHKAVVFDQVLGYNESNYQELIKAIRTAVGGFPVTTKGKNSYGEKYEVIMDITGPSGETAPVITGWIVDTGTTTPRLTSAYVQPKKGGKKKRDGSSGT